jgi:hypothetical protein
MNQSLVQFTHERITFSINLAGSGSKGFLNKKNVFTRMVNLAKSRSFNATPRFQYGYEIPQNYNHALQLDEKNGNSLWKDAIDLELQQIMEYQTFNDQGHHTKSAHPSGYKRIRVH